MVTAFFFTSCQKFLDAKPDKRLVVPTTVNDIQAMLDNTSDLNLGYANLSESGSDNFYITDAAYNALSEEARNAFLWNWQGLDDLQWYNMYRVVFLSNVALESLEKIEGAGTAAYNSVKGAAYFFRAFSFYHSAQIWTLPYDESTAALTPGLPLRLSSDINLPTVRPNLKQTYQQILDDISNAIPLLPEVNVMPTRPNKAAAYALLARVLLQMNRFEEARVAASSALDIYNVLLDYNTINASANAPIARFNTEVMFHAQAGASDYEALRYTVARVDSNLYRSYNGNDLRQKVFFGSNTDGSYFFKAGYHGSRTDPRFCGLTVSEVYLIRAECAARAGDIDSAFSDLKTLLGKRFKTGAAIVLPEIHNTDEALLVVLQERRKELCFRVGARWSDLKRFGAVAGTIVRKINNQEYKLQPGDLKYAVLIPQSVITMAGIQQNAR
jgi:tetratricopeptide (TPR) repeat protein